MGTQIDTAKEVERKFLLRESPPDLHHFPHERIRQGYLAIQDDGTEVRVRKRGGRHLLTVKSGGGTSRDETEVALSRDAFARLWPLTRGRRVRKVRYRVPHDGLTVEIDVYRRRLKGLVTAEIEFPGEDEARRFEPPDWLGREVTGDGRFSNQNLARHGNPEKPAE